MNEDDDLLSQIAYVLNTPGDLARGLIAKASGYPNWRATGNEFLEHFGVEDPGFLASLGTELAIDPLNLISGAGMITKLAKARKLAALNKGIEQANAASDLMRAEGALPEELIQHLSSRVIDPETGTPIPFFRPTLSDEGLEHLPGSARALFESPTSLRDDLRDTLDEAMRGAEASRIGMAVKHPLWKEHVELNARVDQIGKALLRASRALHSDPPVPPRVREQFLRRFNLFRKAFEEEAGMARALRDTAIHSTPLPKFGAEEYFVASRNPFVSQRQYPAEDIRAILKSMEQEPWYENAVTALFPGPSVSKVSGHDLLQLFAPDVGRNVLGESLLDEATDLLHNAGRARMLSDAIRKAGYDAIDAASDSMRPALHVFGELDSQSLLDEAMDLLHVGAEGSQMPNVRRMIPLLQDMLYKPRIAPRYQPYHDLPSFQPYLGLGLGNTVMQTADVMSQYL